MRMTSRWLWATLVLLAMISTPALGIDVELRYAGVVGQASARGVWFQPAGGRIAIDEKGNVYNGTPGGHSFVQKLAADGTVIWQQFTNIPGYQATAVDDKHLYTAGGGYYGWRQIQRRDRQTGILDEAWSHEFRDRETRSRGVEPIGTPTAIELDDKYVLISDSAAGVIRRLSKQTGLEAPFAKPLAIELPRDLARDEQGQLLILTPTAVYAVSADGVLEPEPRISDLRNASALAFDALRRLYYIAEAGDDPKEPVNVVRIFDSDGAATETVIGSGGSFHGHWDATKFSFHGPSGDVAIDPRGNVWIQPGWADRMDRLRLLSVFSATGRPMRTYMSSVGDGLAVDDAGRVVVGGTFMFDAKGQLTWTSGMVSRGDVVTYPTTHPNWWTMPVWAGGRLFIFDLPKRRVMELDIETGEKVGEPYIIDRELGGTLSGISAVGDDLFIYNREGQVYRLHTSFAKPPELFFEPPAALAITAAGIAIHPDLNQVVIARDGDGDRTQS